MAVFGSRDHRVGYSVSSGYTWLSVPVPEVSWASWVWNRMCIPKHRFISWLVMWRKLRTKSFLKKAGIAADNTCVLCQNGEESMDHLFFGCAYSVKCCHALEKCLSCNLAQM